MELIYLSADFTLKDKFTKSEVLVAEFWFGLVEQQQVPNLVKSSIMYFALSILYLYELANAIIKSKPRNSLRRVTLSTYQAFVFSAGLIVSRSWFWEGSKRCIWAQTAYEIYLITPEFILILPKTDLCRVQTHTPTTSLISALIASPTLRKQNQASLSDFHCSLLFFKLYCMLF